MTRPRLSLLFPAIFVVLTLALWFCSKAQYRSFIHSDISHSVYEPDPEPPFSPSDGWPEMWTDYVPFPLEIAGALNAPVATLAYPTYRLLHRDTSVWTLAALLAAVVAQWGYVGWAWYNRKNRDNTRTQRVLAALGVPYGVFVLVVSLQMHHVTLMYKTGAMIWAVLICWHFGKVLVRPAFAAR